MFNLSAAQRFAMQTDLESAACEGSRSARSDRHSARVALLLDQTLLNSTRLYQTFPDPTLAFFQAFPTSNSLRNRFRHQINSTRFDEFATQNSALPTLKCLIMRFLCKLRLGTKSFFVYKRENFHRTRGHRERANIGFLMKSKKFELSRKAFRRDEARRVEISSRIYDFQVNLNQFEFEIFSLREKLFAVWTLEWSVCWSFERDSHLVRD